MSQEVIQEERIRKGWIILSYTYYKSLLKRDYILNTHRKIKINLGVGTLHHIMLDFVMGYVGNNSANGNTEIEIVRLENGCPIADEFYDMVQARYGIELAEDSCDYCDLEVIAMRKEDVLAEKGIENGKWSCLETCSDVKKYFPLYHFTDEDVDNYCFEHGILRVPCDDGCINGKKGEDYERHSEDCG